MNKELYNFVKKYNNKNDLNDEDFKKLMLNDLKEFINFRNECGFNKVKVDFDVLRRIGTCVKCLLLELDIGRYVIYNHDLEDETYDIYYYNELPKALKFCQEKIKNGFNNVSLIDSKELETLIDYKC